MESTVTDIDDLARKVNGLIGALKTSHEIIEFKTEIIEFKTETISRLEMEITQLRKEITYASRCVPKKAMRKIIDFALAAGYPSEEHLDEVAAFLDTLEE